MQHQTTGTQETMNELCQLCGGATVDQGAEVFGRCMCPTPQVSRALDTGTWLMPGAQLNDEEMHDLLHTNKEPKGIDQHHQRWHVPPTPTY